MALAALPDAGGKTADRAGGVAVTAHALDDLPAEGIVCLHEKFDFHRGQEHFELRRFRVCCFHVESRIDH